MSLSQALLPEFDYEMANTRKCLERMPQDRFDWSPHEKSWNFRELSTHVANLPRWTVPTIEEESFDFEPVAGEPVKDEPVDSVEEALRIFDASVAAARQSLAQASDETLLAQWRLLKTGEEVMAMPRIAVLRSFLMNHLIHHRAQLALYLRLCDVPVPALYGPSADEES